MGHLAALDAGAATNIASSRRDPKSGTLTRSALGHCAASELPAIPVGARNTVGAGDSMLADSPAQHGGMAAALLGSGTQLCRLSDVERLRGQLP
jgi:hypothetical protein